MIRRGCMQDIPAMVRLLDQLFSIEGDFEVSHDLQSRGLELLLASPSAAVMVAEEDGNVIGMVTAQVVISTAEGGPALLVEDLVIAPNVQKKGYGSALLFAIAEWGVSIGASRLQLLADKTNNPALNFYRHLGWQETQLICLRKYAGY